MNSSPTIDGTSSTHSLYPVDYDEQDQLEMLLLIEEELHNHLGMLFLFPMTCCSLRWPHRWHVHVRRERVLRLHHLPVPLRQRGGRPHGPIHLQHPSLPPRPACSTSPHGASHLPLLPRIHPHKHPKWVHLLQLHDLLPLSYRRCHPAYHSLLQSPFVFPLSNAPHSLVNQIPLVIPNSCSLSSMKTSISPVRHVPTNNYYNPISRFVFTNTTTIKKYHHFEESNPVYCLFSASAASALTLKYSSYKIESNEQMSIPCRQPYLWTWLWGNHGAAAS